MERIITDNLKALADICRRHYVKTLWVFGSATGKGIDGNEFGPDSDVDLLVEYTDIAYDFENFDYIGTADGFLEELQLLFGRKVDVVNNDSIRNRRFRQYVEQQKQLLYAA